VTALRRARLAAAWLLGLWLATLYVRAGWGKFAAEGFWADAFRYWGYPSWFRLLVGVVEVVCGVALVVPWVASYSALALSLVMAGAWGTLAHAGRWADLPWVTAYVAALSWIVYEWWWRRLATLRQHPPSA
jgi:uncharacterized membrane protein YphA (DoxX/SURF4 family)